MRLNMFCLLILAGLIVSLFCSGCGGAGREADLQPEPARPQAGTPGALEAPSALPAQPGPGAVLPAPSTLLRQASYTPYDLVRNGADIGAGLPRRFSAASPDGALDLNPHGSGPGEFAYAIYSFPLGDYDLDSVLFMAWEKAPALEDLWLATANFQSDRWDLHRPQENWLCDFGSFGAYASPPPQRTAFIAVIAMGTQSARLGSLSIGPPPAPDSVFLIPERTKVPPGTSVRVTCYCWQTAHEVSGFNAAVTHSLQNTYTPMSYNTGAPGGERWEPDGIWLSNPPENGLIEFGDGLIQTWTAPDGTPYTAMITGAWAPPEFSEATGELFNFELTVNEGGLISLLRQADGIDQTYANGTFGLDQIPWSCDNNAGWPGLWLIGQYPPTARLLAAETVGEPGLSVTLDASGSRPATGHSIVRYEYDFGDGAGWQDFGSASSVSHVYDQAGRFTPCLRVTDELGLQATARAKTVVTLHLDETENNDSLEQANQLPVAPFSGWRGNVGVDENYIGADSDGDYFDMLRLPQVQPGRRVKLVLRDSTFDPREQYYERANLRLLDPELDYYEQVKLTALEDLPGQKSMVLQMPFIDSGDCLELSDGWSFCSYDLSMSFDPPEARLDTVSVDMPEDLDETARVQLDASGSFAVAPARIVKYELLYDDDKGWEDFGDNPYPQFSLRRYDMDGVWLRVTDSNGQTAYTGQHFDSVFVDDVQQFEGFDGNVDYSGNERFWDAQKDGLPVSNYRSSGDGGFTLYPTPGKTLVVHVLCDRKRRTYLEVEGLIDYWTGTMWGALDILEESDGELELRFAVEPDIELPLKVHVSGGYCWINIYEE